MTVLAFLVGAATYALLASVNRDATIVTFGIALVILWTHESLKHLEQRADRLTALRRLREWGIVHTEGDTHR